MTSFQGRVTAPKFNGNLIHENPSPTENIGMGPNILEINVATQKKNANLNHLILIQDQLFSNQDFAKNDNEKNVNQISAGLLSIRYMKGPNNQK